MIEETRFLSDHQNRPVRLTPERWQHILEHTEMVDQLERLAETLRTPEVIIATHRDPTVQCYHRYYEDTPVTRKFLMVAVKVLDDDAFVVTAHFMSHLKRGETLWQK